MRRAPGGEPSQSGAALGFSVESHHTNSTETFFHASGKVRFNIC